MKNNEAVERIQKYSSVCVRVWERGGEQGWVFLKDNKIEPSDESADQEQRTIP